MLENDGAFVSSRIEGSGYCRQILAAGLDVMIAAAAEARLPIDVLDEGPGSGAMT
jgi:hypothetical protein